MSEFVIDDWKLKARTVVKLYRKNTNMLVSCWAVVKCEVRVCEDVKCEVRCEVGCDWSVASGSYPTVIKFHRRQRLSGGGLLNGRQSPTSRLSGVATVAQRIRSLLN